MLTVVNTACVTRSCVCYTVGSWIILNHDLPPGVHVYPTKYLLWWDTVLDVTVVSWLRRSFLSSRCWYSWSSHLFVCWEVIISEVLSTPQGSKISSGRVYVTFILGYLAFFFFFQIVLCTFLVLPWLNLNLIWWRLKTTEKGTTLRFTHEVAF